MYQCYLDCGDMPWNSSGRNTTVPTIKENDECVSSACQDLNIACSLSQSCVNRQSAYSEC